MTVHSGWFDCEIDISDSTTISDAVDLGQPYDYLDILIPPLTSCNLAIHVADSISGTYYQLGGTTVVKTAGTGAFADVFILLGYRYLKIVASAAQAADRVFKVRGGRY